VLVQVDEVRNFPLPYPIAIRWAAESDNFAAIG
jgi:hypothetical protein